MFSGLNGLVSGLKYFKASAQLVVGGFDKNNQAELSAGVDIFRVFIGEVTTVIKSPQVLLLGDPFASSRKQTQDACAKFGIKI